MDALPPELLLIPPLAIGAGIDLYLTLLLLGAAPTTPWWIEPLPGGLRDLDSLQVLLMVGVLYLLEFGIERFPAGALVWNALHAIIRPVSGALLALLVLEGQSPFIVIGGMVAAGALASLAHAIRSGRAIVRWLDASRPPHVLLVSLLEDVIVLGLVSLALDRPLWACWAVALLAAPFSLGAAADVKTFAFAVRLAVGRVFQTLLQRRWRGSEELPAWVREALQDDVMAPGGGLRGSPVGALRLPGAGRFSTGWLVVRGDTPVFLFVSRNRPRLIDLGPLLAEDVFEGGFFRRLDLRASTGGRSCVFFRRDGPSPESLRAEFGSA